MNHHRPIGLTCLAFVAGLISITLSVLGVGAFFHVVSLFKNDGYKPDYYPIGYILFAVAGVCLLLVAWIASITAFDLWKFKSRGRSTTIAGTLILGVCTLLLILRHAFQGLEFWLAVLVLLFSFETVVYLRQASVRSQFESKPGQEGDS
jgi:hypothetical protein